MATAGGIFNAVLQLGGLFAFFCADLVKNGFVSVKIDLCVLSCAEAHAYSAGCREQSWLDPSCRALLPQGINDI